MIGHEQTGHPQVPAGFWVRAGALSIDIFALLLAAPLFGAGLGLVEIILKPDRPLLSVGIILFAEIFIPFFYFVVCWAIWGKTPGKMLAGIRVVRKDGGPLSVGQAIGRFLSYFISAISLYTGFLMAAFMDQKQGLHDLMSGTKVVYDKPDASVRQGIMAAIGVIFIASIFGCFALFFSLISGGPLTRPEMVREGRRPRACQGAQTARHGAGPRGGGSSYGRRQC